MHFQWLLKAFILAVLVELSLGGRNRRSRKQPDLESAVDQDLLDMHPFADTYDRALLARGEDYLMHLAKAYDFVHAMLESEEKEIREYCFNYRAFRGALSDPTDDLPNQLNTIQFRFQLLRKTIPDWVLWQWFDLQLENMLNFGYPSVQAYELFANVHRHVIDYFHDMENMVVFSEAILDRGYSALSKSLRGGSASLVRLRDSEFEDVFRPIFLEFYRTNLKDGHDIKRKINIATIGIRKLMGLKLELRAAISVLQPSLQLLRLYAYLLPIVEKNQAFMVKLFDYVPNKPIDMRSMRQQVQKIVDRALSESKGLAIEARMEHLRQVAAKSRPKRQELPTMYFRIMDVFKYMDTSIKKPYAIVGNRGDEVEKLLWQAYSRFAAETMTEAINADFMMAIRITEPAEQPRYPGLPSTHPFQTIDSKKQDSLEKSLQDIDLSDQPSTSDDPFASESEESDDLMQNFESYQEYIDFILKRDREAPENEHGEQDEKETDKMIISNYMRSPCSRLRSLPGSTKFQFRSDKETLILDGNDFTTLCRIIFPQMGAQNVKFADVENLVIHLGGRIQNPTGSIDRVWIPALDGVLRKKAVWHRSHVGKQSGMGFKAAGGVRRVLRHFNINPADFEVIESVQ